ncbi:alpha-2-macroglobulin family protein [Sphingobacterium multivorum]|uniref:alpha-2-macroglobulin family protein n=1 Tax=Sphingobacterium multivorum TaxID=28454 RepID=UPI0028A1FF84|nr:alpha-2-macroglobulin family protein [Sphingobacterium multivorum]
MKWKSIVVCFLAVLYSVVLCGQSTLFNSPRGSSDYYIYKLSPEVLRKIHLGEKKFDETMLSDFFLKYKAGSPQPTLPPGNYVQVRASGADLIYQELISDNLYVKIIPAETFAICLYDSLGTIIKDAQVKVKGRRMSFDKKFHYYKVANANNDDIVSIEHKGVYHYLSVERSWPYKDRVPLWKGIKNSLLRTKFKIKRFFHKQETEQTESFMVFNKPMYKPNEQVKFKAYLEEEKWKPYRDSIAVRLTGGYGYAKDTVLTRLAPYRPGMYTFEFNLKGLGLILDKDYGISLESTKTKVVLHQQSFRYEDYELKSLSFNMTSEKTKYAKGDSVRLKLKALNENEMPIYDGKVDLRVVTSPLYTLDVKANKVNFIPDTLWQTSVSLADVAEKEIVLPDSIFPADIGLTFRAIGTYLSSDNERIERSLDLNILNSEKEIRIAVKDGHAELKYFEKGVAMPTTAQLMILGEHREMLKTENLSLPNLVSIPWQAEEIVVKSNGLSKSVYLEDQEQAQLNYRFYRTADSVILHVNNPAMIPFWYRVHRAGRTIASGYHTTLNSKFLARGKDGYSMEITYLFGGKSKVIQEELPYVEKNLNLAVNTATTVYPGQKADVELSVTDKNGKPLKDVDIMAYGFTSKFRSATAPNITMGGLMRRARVSQNLNFSLDDDEKAHQGALQNWVKWSRDMQLDTMAFYRFLYPKDYYQESLPLDAVKSQISPYVVVNGVVQGIHLVWIDGVLTYAKQDQQNNNTIFEVSAGQHDFRFRTKDRDIRVSGFYLEKGKKVIVSFNASQDTIGFTYPEKAFSKGQILVYRLPKEERGKLYTNELTELKRQLITVTNNFGAWQLPNNHVLIERPAYIQTAGDLYYLNPLRKTVYDSRLRTQVPVPLMVGPFPRTEIYNGVSKIGTLMVDTAKIGRFEIEGGYQYSIYKNYQKQKSWDGNPLRIDLYDFKPNLDFQEKVWSLEDIKANVERTFKEIMQNSTGLAQFATVKKGKNEAIFKLNLTLGNDVEQKGIRPTLIFIEPTNVEERMYFRLFYGGHRTFGDLPVGDVTLHIVKDDSTSFSLPIKLKANGMNYLRLDSIQWSNASQAARLAYKLVRDEIIVRTVENPLRDSISHGQEIVPQLLKIDREDFRTKRKNNKVARVLVYDRDTPLIGAKVSVPDTKKRYFTSFDGSVELELSDDKNTVLEIAALGYNTATVKVSSGKDYFVELKPSENQLDEVVVVGYGVQKRQSLTAAVKSINARMDGVTTAMLQGAVAGIRIRGAARPAPNEKPLILVDGVPFEGDISSLDPSTIASLNVIKDQSMLGLYGARAANGVVMVQMKAGASATSTGAVDMPYLESGNTMRVNFRDDAFWQPKLTTDAQGKVNFEATYPDDITNWRTFFIAKGSKNFADIKELNVKSFKAVSAHLATPRFAIRSDQFTAMGRVVNYLSDSLQLLRTINNGLTTQEATLKIAKSYRDPISVIAAQGDSVQLAYSIELSNGYFDGEKRSIPIFEKGLEQHEGDFKVLNSTAEYLLKTSPALGEITLHAEANSLEFLQREIESIDRYKFLCNEQMASKLSALLSKKELTKLIGKPFTEDKKIKDLLKELQKNKNSNQGWGWWNKSETVTWISNYVIGVLLDAREAGYQVEIDTEIYAEREKTMLKSSLASLDVLLDKDKLHGAKENLFSSLIYLLRLDTKADYKDYFFEIDTKLKSKTIKDKLLKYLLISKLGLKDLHAADTVLKYASKAVLGGLYWTSGTTTDQKGGFFMRPTETNTVNTLLAYGVLKSIGGHDSDLENIRNYFFAQRQQNQWYNIYESSRIIRSILPDVLKEGESFQAPVMVINGKRVTAFPYTQSFKSDEQIKVRKEGTGPAFVTAYQNFWNPNPAVEKEKGFAVATRFKDNGATVAALKEGKPVKLEASVTLTGEAEYVQIEVPIPAGCSYETKTNGYYRIEAHREHFKDRVVIFCNKLGKGTHTFEIELLPRYTGTYTVNPAKAELMYFPTYYGNEKMKEIVVE